MLHNSSEMPGCSIVLEVGVCMLGRLCESQIGLQYTLLFIYFCAEENNFDALSIRCVNQNSGLDSCAYLQWLRLLRLKI